MAHCFSKLAADGVDGTQSRHRVLGDERDVFSANIVQDLRVSENVLTLEHGFPGKNRKIVRKQSENPHGCRRLSGAGFTDDGDGFTGVDAEGHAVDGSDDGVRRDKFDLEIVDP